MNTRAASLPGSWPTLVMATMISRFVSPVQAALTRLLISFIQESTWIRHAPVLKSRITQAVSERKEAGRAARAVEVAVPNLQTLGVDRCDRMPKIMVPRIILQALRPCERQLSRWIDFAKENIGNAVSALVPSVIGVKDSERSVDPRHFHRHAGLSNDDRLRLHG